MAKKIYIGNLSYKADEESLRELFQQYGEVMSAKIITDAATGQSRGFGFVEMTSEEEADKAIAGLNGTSFLSRNIVVNEARPQTGGRGRAGGAQGRQRNHYGRGREEGNWRYR